jgi:hypothetical protein
VVTAPLSAFRRITWLLAGSTSSRSGLNVEEVVQHAVDPGVIAFPNRLGVRPRMSTYAIASTSDQEKQQQ